MNHPDFLYREIMDRQRELLDEGGRMQVARERRHHSYAGLMGQFLRQLADGIDPIGRSRQAL